MTALILLFVGVIGAAWWRALGAWLPRGEARSGRALLAAMALAAQLTVTPLALAVAGQLWIGPLVVVNAIVTAGMLAASFYDKIKNEQNIALPLAFRPELPAFFRLTLVEKICAGAVAGLLGLVGIYTVWHGSVYAPWTYDDLNYRLPIAAWMLQDGRYAIPHAHMEIIDAYPRGAELIFYWLLAWGRRSAWVDLAQVPFVGICLLAIYRLARELGLARPAGTAAAMLFAFIPVVAAQIMTAYADVIFTAYILSAAAFALAFVRARKGSDLMGLGLALGLMLGVKFTAGPYVIVFAAWVAGMIAIGKFRKKAGEEKLAQPAWPRWPMWVAAAALAIEIGGYAWGRNWVLHGNPVFPYAARLGPLQFEGPFSHAAISAQHVDPAIGNMLRIGRSWSEAGVIDHSGFFGGWGYWWWMMGPLILAALVVARRRGRAWEMRNFPAVAFLLLGLYAVTIDNYRARYTMFLPGLACLAFGLLWQAASANPRLRNALCVYGLAACAVSYWQLDHRYYKPLREMDGRARDRAGNPANHSRPRNMQRAYREARDAARAGSTTYYFGVHEIFVYPLWNADFSNRVEHRVCGTREEFMAMLNERAEAGDILFMPATAGEQAILREQMGRFEIIFEDEAAGVYRFKE